MFLTAILSGHTYQMHTMRRFTILTVYIRMVYHLLGTHLRLLAPRRRPFSIALAAPQLRPVQGIHSIWEALIARTITHLSDICPVLTSCSDSKRSFPDTLMHTSVQTRSCTRAHLSCICSDSKRNFLAVSAVSSVVVARSCCLVSWCWGRGNSPAVMRCVLHKSLTRRCVRSAV